MISSLNREIMLELGLKGMFRYCEDNFSDPGFAKLDKDSMLEMLLQAERHERQQRKQNRMMKAAKLKYAEACVENIDFISGRNLDREQIAALINCQWIELLQFLFFIGPAGTGKTYLGCAFGNQAIRKGIATLYKRVPRLLEEIEVARAEGNLPKFRQSIAKMKLLILDDWAVAPLSARNRQDLLEIIEDRVGNGSLIITSQLPVNDWHAYIGEATLADAILDRLLHRAHIVELKGESMRKLYGMKREANS